MIRIAILCCLLSATQDLSAQGPDSVYLFAFFRDNGQDGLHLAWSEDGYRFEALNGNRSFLRPVTGKDSLMRDPCIIQGPDGYYHMVWTTSWTDLGIGYARSENLVDWSSQRFLPVMAHEGQTRNCWAPEITWDPAEKAYFIYWASTIRGRFPAGEGSEDDYNHRIYYTRTPNLQTFSRALPFYDKGFNVIDATVKRDGARYLMFLKDETLHPDPQKNIRLATAPAMEGPWSEPSGPITGAYWAEGPTVTHVEDYWVVYFDKYRDHRMGAVRSRDLKNWEDISDRIRFPEGTRHGTVFRAPRSLLRQLNAVSSSSGG